MQNIHQQYPFQKATRLPNYCYAEANYYFVTICTHNHKHWFGEIQSNKMKLNQYGMIKGRSISKAQSDFLSKDHSMITLFVTKKAYMKLEIISQTTRYNGA